MYSKHNVDKRFNYILLQIPDLTMNQYHASHIDNSHSYQQHQQPQSHLDLPSSFYDTHIKYRRLGSMLRELGFINLVMMIITIILAIWIAQKKREIESGRKNMYPSIHFHTMIMLE
jgi:hypothetical protein